MPGNSIGQQFRVTTFGESHGSALGCIIDGVPPNLEISCEEIQYELDRRRPGSSRYTTPRQETDQVEILSGIFEGKTTGTSIGLIIRNKDQHSQDYNNIKELFRPGHADYTYYHKYGNRDYRGGGRASARETTMRVAAGAIAKKYLRQQFQLEIIAYIDQIGNIKISPTAEINYQQINSNPFFCPDEKVLTQFATLIEELVTAGNSVGAGISVLAKNVPIGLGEPVFDKLDAELAKAYMSINAVKGVEIGDGFAVISQKGSEHRDQLTKDGFLSNSAGGILGGISSGQDISARLAFKPTSSIKIAGRTLNLAGEEVSVVTEGRHDPCVGIRAVPIVEAMTAIVLMDHCLRHKAQCK